MSNDSLSAPILLDEGHDLSDFACGEAVLDEWLRRRALKNNKSGASRTYVVLSQHKVVGYVSLAAGQISHAEATGPVRRNMPDPVPVMVLARLAVHRDWQGRGIGKGLVREAVLRTLQASGHIGISAIIVHALNDDVRHYYESLGFRPSPLDPQTLMIGLKGLAKRLGLE